MNKPIKIKCLICTVIFIILLGLGISAIAKNHRLSPIDTILRKQGYAAINIIIKNGFMFIKTSVNKHLTMAIIDTGSSGISIAKGSAEKLQLSISNTTKNASVDMHGKKSFRHSVILPHVTISDIQLSNVSANILQQVSTSNTPTLVIGRDFLKCHHAIIDIYHNKLYLGHKKLSQLEINKIQKALLNKRLLAIPLMSLGSGDMVIPLQINRAQPVNFLFDTGTGITLVSKKYAKTLNLKLHNKTNEVTIKKLVLNPLNINYQPKITLNNISAQPENLAILTKYLHVQGIFGLSDMIKAHAIIFVPEGMLFVRSNIAK